MPEWLALVSFALTAIAGVYSLWLVIANKPVDNILFWMALALEVMLLVVVVVGIAALLDSTQETGGAVFVSYLATAAILLPLAFLWGVAEKSRWGTGAFLVVLFSTYVLLDRMVELWPTA